MANKVDVNIRDAYIGEKRKQIREGSTVTKLNQFLLFTRTIRGWVKKLDRKQ